MKKKITSLLLSASLVLSAAAPIGAVYAEEPADTGMRINKTVAYNEDKDNFTITLDAYATGTKVTSTTTRQIPTDIILVLDQSGSMKYDIEKSAGGYDSYTGSDRKNSNLYSKRANDGGSNELYYKMSDTNYVSVSVVKEVVPVPNYTRVKNSNSSNFSYNHSSSDLYALLDDGTYQRVTVAVTNIVGPEYTYTMNGVDILTSSEMDKKPDFSKVDGIADSRLYTRSDSTVTRYTYSYTIDDVTHVIGTSDGDDKEFTGAVLYHEGAAGTEPRLDALKSAIVAFKNDVSSRAMGADGVAGTDDDVNHRVAMVGFSSKKYHNTELLTGVTVTRENFTKLEDNNTYYFPNTYQYNGPQYFSEDKGSGTTRPTLTDEHYGSAFLDMNTTSGQNALTTSINYLTAYGGTQTQSGFDMALQVLNANPLQDGEQRNRVVVLFTDGIPGNSGFDSDVADDAIENAKAIKDAGATVYTVGIFDGASIVDESIQTEEGHYEGSGKNRKWVVDVPAATNEQKANWFMNAASSNYPNATAMNSRGSRIDKTYDDAGNLESYYLVAKDSSSLSNIFEMISNQVSHGGATTSLTEQTILKDLISPQFTLPEGARVSDINVKMVPYKPANVNSPTYTEDDWDYKNASPAEEEGVTATIGTDTAAPDGSAANGSLSVTGYNFSEHWVGIYDDNGTKKAQGAKLQITFDVDVREGFLGGNSVYTNTEAKVYLNYADSCTGTAFMTFPQPEVNVPISAVTVNAEEKNVYLLGDVTKDEMINGATVKVGNEDLDLNHPYDATTGKIYGLETWQTEYVNITVEYMDKDGNVIYRELNGAKDQHTGESFDASPVSSDYTVDDDFTISVTVTPKDKNGVDEDDNPLPGVKAVEQDEETSAKVNVFKPVMTFKDSHVYLGGEVSGSYSHGKNFVSVDWVHKDASGAVDMTAGTGDGKAVVLGTAPTLTETYETKSGIISTDTDIDVDVTEVKIGDTVVTGHVTFDHQECVENPKLEPTCTEMAEHAATAENTPEFKLHVYTPEMTFVDTTKYYGETAPTLDDATFLDATKTTWKYQDGTVAGDQMSNTAPTLTTTYAVTIADAAKIANGKINTPDGKIGVEATVKAGSVDLTALTKFNHSHNGCDASIESHMGDAASNEAWIHIENCKLTVKKVGGDADGTYILNVMKDGVKYTELVLTKDSEATIYRLPVGTYTIQEDTNWSWRYTPTNSGDGSLTGAAKHEGTLTCTNTPKNNKKTWLDGFSPIVTNVKSK